MISTLHRLKFFLFILTLACFGQVQAQECEDYGVVSRGFLLGKFNCESLILSSDGIDIFQPTEMPADFGPGSLIRFSYELLDSTDCADDVPLIEITCINSLFESSDTLLTTCNFEITSTIFSDTLDVNTYELEVFNETDFGAYHPQTAKWYEYETGKVLGDEPIIFFSPTETTPDIVNICVDITDQALDNSTCAATLCHTIVPETIFPDIENCQALFFYQPTDQLADNGTIDFYNLSFGNYTEIIWDFGDGLTDTSDALTFAHTYSSPGLYEVCVSIQDSVNDCASSFCLPVFTVGGETICDFNDCVFPGDANKDGTVNIFDALNLGIGYNAVGEVRPNAAIEPNLQAAFDWDLNTLLDLNFKHLDCNGDGLVDAEDFVAIDQNYQRITQNKTFETSPSFPEISLKFAADTLYFNPSQTKIEILANLSVGNSIMPIDNFYGLAFSFNYNNPLIKSIQTNYIPNAFFGDTATFFTEDKFLENDQQYGFAITKTDQTNVTGEGDIAVVSFILELDILDGRSQVLELDLNELTPIDSNGEEIPVSIPSDTTRVVLIFDENLSVNTEEHLTDNQFQIYPNPANDFLVIDLAKAINLVDNKVEIFNTLGQRVWMKSLSQHQNNLDISTLITGVYWVKIYTENGVGVQEIVVE